MESFSGTVSPARTGLLYKIGLAVVAFAMVLLPIVYLGLIVLTGWGVLWHLRHDTWLFKQTSGRSGFLGFLIYLAPAVIGGILVFFMVKPFSARRTNDPDPLTLDPAREPVVFAFVNKICALVGAPAPGRIDVDCQVNASASLSRGVWSRDLVLTIGLPLVSGLEMRQFAGVLAHEFGHFAQGAGLRLTYLIRNINLWFARVVYERDTWDVQLEEAARGTDPRIGFILHAARGCVWLTRRILWALMHAGNAISCFMLRQMEYDADRYEAKVAGSDVFRSTADRLRLLNAATSIAYEDVRESWATRRLPENLPLLIDHKATLLAQEMRPRIDEADARQKTRWFDTHPCDADRVRAVDALHEPGVFRRTEPAGELFADFAALSRAVTRHQYEKYFELSFTDQDLMPADEILRESQEKADANAMIRQFCGEMESALVTLPLSDPLPPLLDETAARAQWTSARQSTEGLLAEAEVISTECAENLERLKELIAAQRLALADFPVSPKVFRLPESATAPGEIEALARRAIGETEEAIAQRRKRLEPFAAALGARVSLALQFAVARAAISPGTGQSGSDVVAVDSARSESRVFQRTVTMLADELATWIRLLGVLEASMSVIHEIDSRLVAFSLFFQARDHSLQDDKVNRVITGLVAEVEARTDILQARLKEFRYPFPHPRAPLTVAEFARQETSMETTRQRTYLDGQAHVNRLIALHHRLLGRIFAVVDEVEGAVLKRA